MEIHPFGHTCRCARAHGAIAERAELRPRGCVGAKKFRGQRERGGNEVGIGIVYGCGELTSRLVRKFFIFSEFLQGVMLQLLTATK